MGKPPWKNVADNMSALREIVDEDVRVEDIEEAEKIDVFTLKGCGCQRGREKSSCSKIFPKEFVEGHRNNCHELTHEQLDMVILGYVSAHRRYPGFVDHYHGMRHKNPKPLTDTERQDLINEYRHTTKYFINDIAVCETTFCFLHTVGRTRLKALKAHLDENGLQPRIHGRTGVSPANSFGPDVLEDVVQFLKSIKEVRAIPIPGYQPNNKNMDNVKLPSDHTKASLHREYEQACNDAKKVSVSLSSFKEIWTKYLPELLIQKPQSDMCQVCQENNTAVMRSAGMPDEIKEERHGTALDHLRKAEEQRQYYNKQCKEVKDNFTEGKLDVGAYSFDYAQNITYPFSAKQVGPAYFKTARRCGLFGILNEATNTQTNYLIDECDSIGKGANSVISMLHHYLESTAAAAEVLHLHADNCCGQNKNNAVIQYLAWRVSNGLNEEIELSFMMPGHTKFGPDRMFGLIKKKYYRCDVDTLGDIETVVKLSTLKNQNQAIITYDYNKGIRTVVWHNWVKYLSHQYKTIPGILSFQHFRIHKDSQSVVHTRHTASGPEEHHRIKAANIEDDSMPEVITPAGMDNQRAWYLYEHVRVLCGNQAAGSLTCPKPTKAKPRKRKTMEE